MSGGYTGKILKINLTTQQIQKEKTNLHDAEQFIGAKGLGAKILIDQLPKNTPPLNPENLLLFTTGPLTGTRAQTSGRGTIVTKSPQTGLFVDSHFGGRFARDMKTAGWDIIIIAGASSKPIYIVIQDEQVAFKDAAKIWGHECLNTHSWLIKNETCKATAVIGPAGENLVNFSAITMDGHRHAGRGGTGAVMGAKNLKAIALVGTQDIPLHDPDAFNKQAKLVLQKIQKHDFVPIRRNYGTPYWVKPVNDWGFLPTRNYQDGQFEHAKAINAETMQKEIVDKGGACWNCAIACWNTSSIKTGKHKGLNLVGPEYETIALMGSNLGLKSISEVAYLNERCNELGMDTISLGGVLGFAVEAYQNNAITREHLNGADIDWGKTEAFAQLINDIAYRKGIGDVLAEGVKKASEKIGKKTSSYAVHCNGLEIPGYDPRGVFGMGLAYATSDRGACHQRAWIVKDEVNNPDYEQFSFAKKAQLVKDTQDDRAAFFSLVLCDFAPISEADCVKMWNLSTGFNHTVESYLQAGERIWNLIRLFNLREGHNPKTDTIPPRLINDPFSKGPAKNQTIKMSEFNKSLKEYYTLRGWNKQGIPTEKKLFELDLTDYNQIVTEMQIST